MKLILLRSAQKELDKLPDNITIRISRKIFDLANNPYPYGNQKLGGDKGYRIRIGNYRIVYVVNKTNKTIVITKIGHRRDVYR